MIYVNMHTYRIFIYVCICVDMYVCVHIYKHIPAAFINVNCPKMEQVKKEMTINANTLNVVLRWAQVKTCRGFWKLTKIKMHQNFNATLKVVLYITFNLLITITPDR